MMQPPTSKKDKDPTKKEVARIYHCSACGKQHDKWVGKCPNPECGRHQTMMPGTKDQNAAAKGEPRVIKNIEVSKEHRVDSGTREFDRVLGGGLVEAGVVLIAGEPGKGKSTLCLQVACMLADAASDPCKVLYVSGEETEGQIKARADRICKDPDSGKLPQNLILVHEVDINRILKHVMDLDPDVLFIDSIQTMRLGEGRAGSVTVVQDVTSMLVGVSKSRSMSTVIVGHVNSEGAIAGPKTMEHLVDTVLSFDEERSSEIRILRCLKNRFGATTEVGIFRMCEGGLMSVDNPAEFLMRGTKGDVGSCLACPMIKPGAGAGERPCIIEVEVMLGRPRDKPKRTITGPYDLKRLEMMLAILESRTGLCAPPENGDPEEDQSLGGYDILLNIPSPYEIEDRSLDLPVALALASAIRNVPLPSGTIAWGEVGIYGQVRPEGGFDTRNKIVTEYGFKRPIASKMGEAISLDEAFMDFYALCAGELVDDDEDEDEDEEGDEEEGDEEGDEDSGEGAPLPSPEPSPSATSGGGSSEGEAEPRTEPVPALVPEQVPAPVELA
jgi:DNA repair protein RadA/Sms